MSLGENVCLLVRARCKLIVPKEESFKMVFSLEIRGDDRIGGGLDEVSLDGGEDGAVLDAAGGVDISASADAAARRGCFKTGEAGGSL